MIVFSIAPNSAGIKMIHPDYEDQPKYLPINGYELSKAKTNISGKKVSAILLNPTNWTSSAAKYIIDPTRVADPIATLPPHGNDIDVLLEQLQSLLQSMPVGAPGGPGLASEATLSAILADIVDDSDSDQFIIFRDSSNGTYAYQQITSEDGVISFSFVTILDPTVTYVPVGTMEPIKGRIQKQEDRFVALAEFVGKYNEGDLIDQIKYIFWTLTSNNPVILLTSYYNTTTQAYLEGVTLNKTLLHPENGRPWVFLLGTSIVLGGNTVVSIGAILASFGATRAIFTVIAQPTTTAVNPVYYGVNATLNLVNGQPIRDHDTVEVIGEEQVKDLQFVQHDPADTLNEVRIDAYF